MIWSADDQSAIAPKRIGGKSDILLDDIRIQLQNLYPFWKRLANGPTVVRRDLTFWKELNGYIDFCSMVCQGHLYCRTALAANQTRTDYECVRPPGPTLIVHP